MSSIPKNLKYTESHEWVSQDRDGTLTVGITDHAQTMLGELVYVELPEEDIEMEAGNECCVLESVKAAADVYCPVEGIITDINMNLISKPDLINKSPFDEGWIFKIVPHKDSYFDDLLSAVEYQDIVKSEAH